MFNKPIKKAEVLGIQWSCLTATQLRALSVVTVTKPSSKDGGANEDRTGTPYDSRLGEQRNRTPCGTCGKLNTDCSGHFGIIELPVPVYNLEFLDVTLKLLQSVCTHCSRPRMRPEYIKMQRFTSRLHAFDRLKAIASKCGGLIKKCPWDSPDDDHKCSEILSKIEAANPKKGDTAKIYYSVTHGGETIREEFTAQMALNVFNKISNETLEILGFNESLLNHPSFTSKKYFLQEDQHHVHQFRPEAMIFEVFLVLPPPARPWVISEQEENERKDDDLTDKYNSMLKSIALWNSLGPKDGNPAKSLSTRRGNMKTRPDIEKDIAEHIWTLINNKDEKSKLSSGGRAHRSLVCRLKGKHGRIQANVGGKRVDFGARTVIIGGGTRLKDDQLGVPEDIASKLTKPEYCIPQNIEDLRGLVAEGKINCIIRNGYKIHLSDFPDKGISYPIMVGDICERQLQDGDFVLFNRQPTLRIESMMAFRVKIVKGDAFQLPLCFTKSFNAD